MSLADNSPYRRALDTHLEERPLGSPSSIRRSPSPVLESLGDTLRATGQLDDERVRKWVDDIRQARARSGVARIGRKPWVGKRRAGLADGEKLNVSESKDQYEQTVNE